MYVAKGILPEVGRSVASGISPLKIIFNLDQIYDGPSHKTNHDLVDTTGHVTDATFSPGNTDHTLLYQRCFGN